MIYFGECCPNLRYSYAGEESLDGQALLTAKRPGWAQEWAAKVTSSILPGVVPPPVGIIKAPRAGMIGGRYFPKHGAILVMDFGDEEITKGTIAHECGHYISYITKCGDHRARSRCGYVGAHDDHFYKLVEPIYRLNGVRPDVARAVEGTYKYPRHWRMIDEW